MTSVFPRALASARGTYLFAVRDIDQMYEPCQFASGFGADLYDSLDTLVDVDASTGWCYSTATDNGTERSQVVGVATFPFSIVWQGRDCGAQLFQGPPQTVGVAGVEKAPSHRSWLSPIKESLADTRKRRGPAACSDASEGRRGFRVPVRQHEQTSSVNVCCAL